jgi:hypothetical protein
VKIIVHGPAAGIAWDGSMRSWGVDEPVDIDDGDAAAVAWARRAVPGGLVTILEDAPAKDEPRRSAVPKR